MKTKYAHDKKLELIQLYRDGQPATHICLAHDIPRSTFYRWIKEVEDSSGKDGQAMNHKLQQRLWRSEDIIAVLKNVPCTASSPLKDRLYALEALHGQYAVRVLCDALDVDRGTFYNHMLRNKKSNTSYQVRREQMSVLVQQVFEESHQIFGAKKIHAVLKQRGHKVSAEYVLQIMRELGLESVRMRSKKTHQKLSNKKSDKLQMNFHVDRPNEIWVSDTTCFQVKGKWMYLCVIIDLYARKVLAHRISPNHSAKLVSATFKEAYASRKPNNLMFHSDRGVQYTANAFCTLLSNLSVKQSFSPTGHPCNNAVMESFFSSLKQEEIYRTTYDSQAQFKERVAAYIVFYNTNRPHSTIGYITPSAFEERYFSRTIKD